VAPSSSSELTGIAVQ
ncbi:colicin release lysis protein, partial [Escherichia coli]